MRDFTELSEFQIGLLVTFAQEINGTLVRTGFRYPKTLGWMVFTSRFSISLRWIDGGVPELYDGAHFHDLSKNNMTMIDMINAVRKLKEDDNG